jgi:hypothetical protein
MINRDPVGGELLLLVVEEALTVAIFQKGASDAAAKTKAIIVGIMLQSYQIRIL